MFLQLSLRRQCQQLAATTIMKQPLCYLIYGDCCRCFISSQGSSSTRVGRLPNPKMSVGAAPFLLLCILLFLFSKSGETLAPSCLGGTVSMVTGPWRLGFLWADVHNTWQENDWSNPDFTDDDKNNGNDSNDDDYDNDNDDSKIPGSVSQKYKSID